MTQLAGFKLLGLLVALALAAWLLGTHSRREGRELEAFTERLLSSLEHEVELRLGKVQVAQREKGELEQLVRSDARIGVPELRSSQSGARAIREVLSVLDIEELELEAISREFTVAENGSDARLTLEVAARARQGEKTRLEQRRVALRLAREAGGWKLADLEVLPKPRDYPEARP